MGGWSSGGKGGGGEPPGGRMEPAPSRVRRPPPTPPTRCPSARPRSAGGGQNILQAAKDSDGRAPPGWWGREGRGLVHLTLMIATGQLQTALRINQPTAGLSSA